jgi:hypothetical protein
MQLIFGWFSSEGISPSSNLSVVDSSGLIPENTNSTFAYESDSIMYADEFGVLRFAENDSAKQQYKHSPILSNSEVSVSSRIINSSNDESLNYSGKVSQLGSRNFVHSYYVSSHFTLQSPLVSNYSGIETTTPIRNPELLNIKVVDNFGNKYVDENGNDKYEIYLDRYISSADSPTITAAFYRIIVTLEASNPQGLSLIYDKFEITNSGVSKNQFLGYKEIINTVPYHEQVAEESEVVDFSSLDRKIYSTQLFANKENALLKNKTNEFGWKAFVPNKAIQDIRTFQSFNWRLVAKVVYNFSNVRNIYSEQDRPKVRCAVISENGQDVRYPYVFHNLSEYPYNSLNFIFENPLATTTNKSSSQYWTVNILNSDILSANYDIVYWAPTGAITDIQAQTIIELSRRKTSVFIDTSSLNPNPSISGLSKLGFAFSSKSVNTGLINLRQEYIDGQSSFNGWNLPDFNETTAAVRYSITGNRLSLFTSSIIPVKVFDTASSYSSIADATIARISSDSLILRKTYNSTVEIESEKPSVYFCSYNISSYLNDNYGTSGLSAVTNNQANNNINFTGTQSGQISLNPIIEGPSKLFFNVVAESIRNKIVSSRIISSDSSLVWHVSPWRNSWTINGKRNNGSVTVLSDEEKSAYNFSDKTEIKPDSISQTALTKFVRQMSVNNTSSLTEIFTNDFIEFSKQDASLIDRDFSNVEFYLECTNNNVGFLNFEDVSSEDYLYGQSESYKTYKITQYAKSQVVSLSPVTLDAFSKIESPEIDFASIRYPFMLVDESEYNSETNDNIKIPKAYLPGAQQSKAYDFDLGIQYSYKKVTEINSNYSINWEIPFETTVAGNGSFTGQFLRTSTGLRNETISVGSMPDEPIVINDSDSRFNGYNYSSKIYSRTDILAADIDETNNVQNNFHFTNDVSKSNRWDEYRVIYKTSTGSSTSSVNSRGTTAAQWSGPTSYISTTYKKGSKLQFSHVPGYSGYTKLKEKDFWSKQVFYDSTTNVIEFGQLFERWLWPFARSKNASNTREYVAGSSSAFLVAEFKKAYPNIYEAEVEKVPVSFSSASTNAAAATSVSVTSSSPTKAVGIKNEYVKYIQYTLNQNGFSLAVNGEYGQSTAKAVYAFQTNASLGFIDGIVDSQTKSVLAIYWLNLLRNNRARFDQLRAAAPDNDIRLYIDRAVQYSDISNIGVPGREYRRISFTGVAGPSKIVDYIIIKVPEGTEELRGINFTSGAWNTIIKHVWVYDQDLVIDRHRIPDYKNSSIKSVANKAVNVNVGANQTHRISIANRKNMKYVMLKLEGDGLSSLGPNGEGFSIKDISFDVLTSRQISEWKTETYYGSFSGVASGKIKGTTVIPSGEYVPLNLKQSLSTLTGLSYINEVYLDNIYVNNETVDNYSIGGGRINISEYSSSNPFYVKYSNGSINNNTINYSSDGVAFTLRPEDSRLVGLSSAPIITSGTKLQTPPVSVPVSNFKIESYSGNNSDGQFVVSSNVSQEFLTEISSNEIRLENFYIKDAEDNTKQIRQYPATVSSQDGLVVLCAQSLLPTGFPNFAQLANVPQNTNISFGFINLIWKSQAIEPYGLRWEFYNTLSKKFYGKKISYYDYMKDGPNNIYVALLAYDNDGDSATRNIIGGDSYNIAISPLPNKILAPLYSTKVASRNKISIQAPPANLSKFDSWFIELTAGKFYKEITIPELQYSNFLINHRGKSLRCLYDTTKIKTNTSAIFGTGHYDIIDENPIIVADNEITVRHGSFHVYQNQLNKKSFDQKYTDANPIVPAVKLKIRKNNSSPWLEIDNEEILSFDKNSGTIIFKKEIVPSNEYNIQVSYTVKSNNALLRHINGSEIPINPFSNENNKDGKPVYIYIVPTYIEYIENGVYIQENNYSYSSPINWTYDYGIFDKAKDSYNPLALLVGTVTLVNEYSFDNISFNDLRVKGGGISGLSDAKSLSENNKNVLSFSDIFSGKGYVYPNGGYVIVKIPKEVKEYFTSEEDLYSIIRSNLTAGVSFDVQDMDGNDWRTI